MHICKQNKCKVNGTYHYHLTGKKVFIKSMAPKKMQQGQSDIFTELFAGLSWLG